MALERDKERELAKRNGTLHTLSQMHGIPFSVKDCINLKGKLTTIDCSFLCDEKYRAEDDAVIVKLFLKAGGIPLVRGNVP